MSGGGVTVVANMEPVGKRTPVEPEIVERPRLVKSTDSTMDPLVVERNLARRMIVGIAIAVPICAGLYAAIVALALGGSDAPVVAPLLMGAGIGAFAACFWGFWFGIAATVREIEEVEARARRHREP
jgi:hypothetical protein